MTYSPFSTAHSGMRQLVPMQTREQLLAELEDILKTESDRDRRAWARRRYLALTEPEPVGEAA